MMYRCTRRTGRRTPDGVAVDARGMRARKEEASERVFLERTETVIGGGD